MDYGDYFAGYEFNPHIDQWEIVGDANPYQAPECREMMVRGKVYNHPKFVDGEVVTTSPIRDYAGNTVETQNTVYDLGRIAPEYEEWCSSMGIDVDSEEPVKIFFR